jgi:hypothetical protein
MKKKLINPHVKPFATLFFIVLILSSVNSLKAQNWNQIIKTAANDRATKTSVSRASSDNFGYSVAVDGDYAVVGAYQEDDDALGNNFISDAGSAFIFKNNGGVWTLVKKLVASDRAANDYFGYSVSISGTTVVIGANQEDEDASGANTFTNAGSAYIFSQDQGGSNNWGEVKKIVASDRAANDNFGISVAISGANIVIGARGESEDAAGTNTLNSSGSAYIYNQDQGGVNNWGQVKKIVASDRAAGDLFGWSVAISGTTAVIGAIYEDEDALGANSLGLAGSAYIFSQDQGGANNWGQVKKLVPSDRAAFDNFGNTVAISGTNVVVGAYYKSSPTYSGAAYIFSQDQGGTNNWGEVKKLVADVKAITDYFGNSVAISGTTVVIGAYQEDEDATGANPRTDAGSAFVFSQDQGGTNNWGQVKKIVPSDRDNGDRFGNSVAISGTTIVIGANFENEDASGINTVLDAGSTYIFNQDQGGTNNWGQQQKVVALDFRGINYGHSVAIDGDYAVVGAIVGYSDINSENHLLSAGSAYILKNEQGVWRQVKKIVPSDRAAGDNFGKSVAISGTTVVIGAHLEDEDASGANTLSGSGSAYIFNRDQGGADNWGQVKKIVASDRAANDLFGYSVAISGTTVVIGAYQEDEDASGGNTLLNAGSAYIFNQNEGGTNNWGQVRKIVASDRAANDNFGISVATNGTTVVIGAFHGDNDATGGNTLNDAGSAYIFSQDQGGTNNWGEVKKLVASDRGAGDNFGSSVAISGTNVVIGAYQEDEDVLGGTTLSNAGSAYIFSQDQGGANNWGQVKKLVTSDRATLDLFGSSVSISGTTVLIGANQEKEDATGANTLSGAGSAYVFSQDEGGMNNWGEVKKLVASDRAINDFFGFSVAISGSTAMVGTHLEDEDASGANTITSSGSAYFFKDCNSISLASTNTTTITAQSSSDMTLYNDANCHLISGIESGNTYTVSGSVTAKVWVETTQPTNIVKRHYEITPLNNPSTATGRVTLYFTQAEFDDYNALATIDLPTGTSDAVGKTNLRILKISGTSSDGTGSIASYGSGTQTTINPNDADIVWNNATSIWEVSFDVTGFSGFFIQSSSTPLPLSILSFTATPQGNDAMLQWQTADEINHSHYEVERSTDASHFISIGTRKGQGNKSVFTYSFIDKEAGLESNLIYYRLKMVATDGSFTNSNIASVRFDGKQKEIKYIYPNPNQGKLNFVMEGTIEKPIDIYVKDISGKILLHKMLSSDNQSLDISFLSNGLYIVETQMLEGNKQIFKLIKQ